LQEKNNDPIIRSLIIIIIGTIAFGLLFNLLTGGSGMEHMGNMGGSNAGTLGGFLGGLLLLLIKLLIVVLVIAVIVGVAMWIKNAFFQNNNYKFVQAINRDPILKTVVYITAAIVGLVILFSLLGNFTNMGANTYGFEMHAAMGNAGLGLYGIVTLLIKVLTFVLVVSLIMALVAFIKKQYDLGAYHFTSNQSHQASTRIVEDIEHKDDIDPSK